MTKQQLIIVHGMGQHTEASFKADVLNACQQAFALYDALQDKEVTDQFEVIPVGYDDIFEEFRDTVAHRSSTLDQRLAKIPRMKPLSAQLAARVNSIESDIADDSFFTTHWLDVILYRFTILNELIRLRVAKRIAMTIAEYGPSNVHVLGHSLGTAVVHDTLAKAYGPEDLRDEEGNDWNLGATTHRLGSVHLVANVSRALESFVRVESSIVKPGIGGCVTRMMEYRHELDPITWVQPFDPKNNGHWVSSTAFRRSYSLKTLDALTGANSHSVGHYLIDPRVHRPLFRRLLDFNPGRDETDPASQRFAALTLPGRAAELREALKDFHPESDDAVKDVIRAAQALRDVVSGFGEAFK